MSNAFFSSTMWNIIQKHGELEVDLSDLFITLSLTAIFGVLWYYLPRGTAMSSRLPPPPPLPPGPRGLPILGYLPFLERDLHRQFTNLASLYGPIFKFSLGSQTCIVLTSPSLYREMVRDKDKVFANHVLNISVTISTFGGNDIAFTPYGSAWKKLRKVFAQEVMNNAVLDSLCSLRREEVKKSILYVYKRIGQPIDINHLAYMTSINSMLRMIWGGSLPGEEAEAVNDPEFRKAVADILFLVGKPNVSDVFPALSWLDVQGIEKETRRLTMVFDRMFDSAIEQRKNEMRNNDKGRSGVQENNKEMRKDFLQFLLDSQEGIEDSETSITMAQLKAILMVRSIFFPPATVLRNVILQTFRILINTNVIRTPN